MLEMFSQKGHDVHPTVDVISHVAPTYQVLSHRLPFIHENQTHEQTKRLDSSKVITSYVHISVHTEIYHVIYMGWHGVRKVYIWVGMSL